MNKRITALLLCALLYPVLGWTNPLPEQLAVPGGIVKIPVAELSQPAPQVFYYKNRVAVTRGDNQWIALVGIPLSAINVFIT